MVTWLLLSGRRYGSVPFLRTSASFSTSRCAMVIGSGMSSGVSSQANPNMRPWSPAPCLSRSVVRDAQTGLLGVVHALRDVRGLLVQRDHDGACVAVEALGGVVVADLLDRGADQVLEVDVRSW